MDISIVIPLYNEAESLPELYEQIQTVMDQNRFSFEVIFVDDGSNDASWQVITELKAAHPDIVRALKFRRNYGKSPALYCGFKKAEGEVVFTMDADLQDNPGELPEMYRMLKEGNYDLISGWKKKRYDSKVSKNLPSKIYNATTRKITGIKLHDMNCGLKAYRREVVKNIEVYGEMHRYIPYLAKNAGYTKIGEKVVQHQKRKFGQSKFGLNRFAHGYLDLMTLWFLSHFGKRPMHFFGLMGSFLFLLGFAAIVVLGVMKISMLNQGIPFRLITDISYFYLALTCILLGTQLFLAGFLAEMISRNASERNNYIVDQEL